MFCTVGLLRLLERPTYKVQWRGNICRFLYLTDRGMPALNQMFTSLIIDGICTSIFNSFFFKFFFCDYELIIFKLMAIVATLILFWQITVDVDHQKAAKRTGRVIDMPASSGDQLQMESGVVTSTVEVWFCSAILCSFETVLRCCNFILNTTIRYDAVGTLFILPVLFYLQNRSNDFTSVNTCIYNWEMSIFKWNQTTSYFSCLHVALYFPLHLLYIIPFIDEIAVSVSTMLFNV